MAAPVLTRSSFAPLGPAVPLAQVIAELTRELAPVPVRRVPLCEGEGAVLAAPLVVLSPVPARATALRGGYAVASGATVGAGPYSPLALDSVPPLVGPGTPLPEGADAVLPDDALVVLDGRAEVQDSVAPGFWTRRAGEDAAPGTVLREAGLVLRPADIAIAGAAGLHEAEIRRPRLLVAGTGDAARLVGTLGQDEGAMIRPAPRMMPDDLADCDLAIVIAYPEERAALVGGLGRLVAGRIALRPGEDGAAALAGSCPVLLIPARLADALALFLGLARPILRLLAGAPPSALQRAPLARKIASAVGIAELALLRGTGGAFEPLAAGDLPLSALAAADAWLIVPPEGEGFAAGETIHVDRPWR